jgi:hypothetical protein
VRTSSVASLYTKLITKTINRGPDTDDKMKSLESAVDASPPDPTPPATWDMRIYSSNAELKAIPSMGALSFVGNARVSTIHFGGSGAGDFKKVTLRSEISHFKLQHSVLYYKISGCH